MFHYRESRGPEIDLLIETGEYLHAIEIKSGATVSSDSFKNFQHLTERMQRASASLVVNNHVVNGGEVSQQRSSGKIVSWRDAIGIL